MRWIPPAAWLTPVRAQVLGKLWARPELTSLVDILAQDFDLELLLVGGAVRDLMLGRETQDLDFLVPCPPAKLLNLAEQLSASLSSTVIVLDPVRGVLRVCARDHQGIDLAALQGDTIEADLHRRDLTVNAILLNPQGELLDPFNGREDLEQKILRQVRPEVFGEDPLRILRCLRLAAALNFTIESQTQDSLRRHSPDLIEVAGERIHDELFKFLAWTDSTLIEQLRQSMALEGIWGVSHLEIPWPWLQQALNTQPQDDKEEGRGPRSEHAVLSTLAVLLFEIRKSPPGGKDWLDRLKLSGQELRFLQDWWRGADLLSEKTPSTPREIYRFRKVVGKAGNGLLDFAHCQAFLGHASSQDIDRLRSGLGAHDSELRVDPMPLTGKELCSHLGKKPGKWVGPVLRELETAWVCREVQDVEELLALSASLV